jgi:C4-dicarboxylate transporter DctQ subunit
MHLCLREGLGASLVNRPWTIGGPALVPLKGKENLMKGLIWLGRLFDRINILMVIIAAILIVGLTFIVGADITLRYCFNMPLGWVKEISEYILVFLGFLVAPWILKQEGHVKMDLVLNHFSLRSQRTMNIITSVISMIVALTVWWFSLRVTVDFYRTELLTPSVLELPKWVLMTPILLGAFLLAIQFMRRAYSFVRMGKALHGQDGDQ